MQYDLPERRDPAWGAAADDPTPKVTHAPATGERQPDGSTRLVPRRGQQLINPVRQMKKRLLREAKEVYGRRLTKRERQRLQRRLRRTLDTIGDRPSPEGATDVESHGLPDGGAGPQAG